MSKKVGCLVIHPRDTVAVVLMDVSPGDQIECSIGEQTVVITSCNPIPRYHKVAVRPMTAGEHVYKYGEVIGSAATDIDIGEHVHTHNVESTHVIVGKEKR